MAATGYTPIKLYASTTAAAVPLAANLDNTNGAELAINITDGKLYYKNNAGVVTLLASTSGASGDVVGPASATDNALARFDLTTGKLIQNSVGILSDAGILTGLTGLTSSGSITLSSLTSGRVTYAGASGLLSDSANLTWDGTKLNTVGTVQSTNSTNTVGQSANFVLNTFNTNFGATNSATLQSVLNNTTTGANDFFIKQFNHNQGTTSDIVLKASSGDSGFVSLYTANIERLRLTTTSLYTASGINVGIGTSSPSYVLDVAGSTARLKNTSGSADFILSRASSSAGASISLNTGDTNKYFFGLRGLGDDNFYFYNNIAGNTALVIDTSSNLGLGVTPSSFQSVDKVIQIGAQGSIDYSSGNFLISNNFSNPSGVDKYIASTYATMYYQSTAGQHIWRLAPSGTAGNNISWTQAMTLDASGRLGVGITSPVAPINVMGLTSSTSTPILYLQQGGAFPSYGYTFKIDNVTTGNLFLNRYDNNVDVGNLLTVSSAGNVGIGDTSPAAPLAISRATNGNFATFSNQTSADFQINLTSGVALLTPTTGILALGTSNTERMRIDSSGNLSLGTTTGNPLNNGGTQKTLAVSGGSGYGAISIVSTATADASIIGALNFGSSSASTNPTTAAINAYLEGSGATNASGNLRFYTRNGTDISERMRITSSGNVGINTTDPDYGSYGATERILGVTGVATNRGRLSLQNTSTGTSGVAGTIAFFNGSTLLASLDVNADGATNKGLYAFNTNNGTSVSERMRIDSSGNLLVGTTSSNGSVSNTAVVLGGYFRSIAGSVSSPTGTYSTLFTVPAGFSSYIVTVHIYADDVNNYQANVIVNTQAGSSTKVTTLVSSGLLAFQMSGYSLQAIQYSGGTQTIYWQAIRIAA